MLHRLRQARLLWPTLAALAGLGVLIGLGTWQLQRKAWKEGLIATIAARVNAEPTPLLEASRVIKGPSAPLAVEMATVAFQRQYEYRHVLVRGHFRHEKETYLYAPSKAGPGWHVYTPLELASGGVVWINRGFVPHARKAPQTRPEGQVTGEVEVKGLVRFPAGKGLFTPENDPGRNIWYWPDLAAMTASASADGLQKAAGASQAAFWLPLIIDADAKPEPPGGLPRGGVTRLELPNRHLEYAVTWYGLALTLVGVFLVFSVSRLRGT